MFSQFTPHFVVDFLINCLLYLSYSSTKTKCWITSVESWMFSLSFILYFTVDCVLTVALKILIHCFSTSLPTGWPCALLVFRWATKLNDWINLWIEKALIEWHFNLRRPKDTHTPSTNYLISLNLQFQMSGFYN